MEKAIEESALGGGARSNLTPEIFGSPSFFFFFLSHFFFSLVCDSKAIDSKKKKKKNFDFFLTASSHNPLFWTPRATQESLLVPSERLQKKNKENPALSDKAPKRAKAASSSSLHSSPISLLPPRAFPSEEAMGDREDQDLDEFVSRVTHVTGAATRTIRASAVEAAAERAVLQPAGGDPRERRARRARAARQASQVLLRPNLGFQRYGPSHKKFYPARKCGFFVSRVDALEREGANNHSSCSSRVEDWVEGGIKHAIVSGMAFDHAYTAARFPALGKIPGRTLILKGDQWKRTAADGRSVVAAEDIEGLRIVTGNRAVLEGRAKVVTPRVTSTSGQNRYHAKFMLLFYEDGVRFIIMSQNLVPSSDDNTENFFVEDFPYRSDLAEGAVGDDLVAPDGTLPRDSDKALDVLLAFFRDEGLGLDNETKTWVRRALLCCDMTSMPGRLVISTWSSTCAVSRGIEAIGEVVAREASLPDDPLHAVITSISFGEKSGISAEVEASWEKDVKEHLLGRTRTGTTRPDSSRLVLQAVIPTKSEATGNEQGEGGFVGRWRNPVSQTTFDLLQCEKHRWHPDAPLVVDRRRALPHTKTITMCDGEGRIFLLYIGSMNMSRGAMGHYLQSGEKLIFKNFELGIVLIPELEERYRRHEHRGFDVTAARLWRESKGNQEQFNEKMSHIKLPKQMRDEGVAGGDEVEEVLPANAKVEFRSLGTPDAPEARDDPPRVIMHFPLPHDVPAKSLYKGDDVQW